ncbi:HD-GYP domain-containing protein [Sporomusa acidovorans]|uniref:Cyclic di-GMP phosphodiesterase response regulator RpfG n=1 Tax=Sporomusa acidovorans (strain ATCC 49682 / DSM 3132 / Mol) TaxID=1123286 RepID=A0ABZ3J1Y8_SPOA4|nr:HD-GYP domain-containing protein [Sporomusa acidovorans]OZC24329.1 cyclic di-GMP phosphodiesterase response regulator RpfG [Sporomusa acidovorans DSM 3132]SDF76572.1 metal dependent phosphohydrolase [Sporomusa acidovorans]
MLNHFTPEDLHEIVEGLTAALDAKNSFMCGHSERVAELSLLLANGLGLPVQEQTRIHIGAHLHDIGKIGVPDIILNKPGKLTNREFAMIRKHPEIGNNIVSKIGVLHPVADIVRHHHERFDGKGYPDGLQGEAISLGARIVAVADAFDAMTSTRAYRPALSFDKTMLGMKKCRGTQFDPAVIDILFSLKSKGEFRYMQGYTSCLVGFN